MIFQTVGSSLRRACPHEDGGMTDGSFGFYLILIRNYSALVQINHKDTKNIKFFKIFFVIFAS